MSVIEVCSLVLDCVCIKLKFCNCCLNECVCNRSCIVTGETKPSRFKSHSIQQQKNQPFKIMHSLFVVCVVCCSFTWL